MTYHVGTGRAANIINTEPFLQPPLFLFCSQIIQRFLETLLMNHKLSRRTTCAACSTRSTIGSLLLAIMSLNFHGSLFQEVIPILSTLIVAYGKTIQCSAFHWFVCLREKPEGKLRNGTGNKGNLIQQHN